MLVEVNPRDTSQRCSCCGYTAKENRVSQALFRCQACGYEENADINAANNIKTVGQTGMACSANRISGRQQGFFVTFGDGISRLIKSPYSQHLKVSYLIPLPFDTLDSINMVLHCPIIPLYYNSILIAIEIMNYLPVYLILKLHCNY